jgi:hypothetical protein
MTSSSATGLARRLERVSRPTARAAAAIIAAAGLALLAAACGGSAGSHVAQLGSTTTQTSSSSAQQNRPVAFARCMRSNRVPNFPDVGKPTPQQLGVSESQYQAAVSACRHLLPNGGNAPQPQQTRTQLADELSFARCMRSHGVTRFPDPTAQAGLTVAMVEAQGIDVHSPAVLRVVQVCLPASHGGLTPAKVREALNNARR